MKKMSLLIAVVCYAPIAYASGAPATVDAVATVFDDVIHFVGYTLSLVLIGLLTMTTQKLYTRWHLTLPSTWLDNAHKYIDQGISYAEEQASKETSTINLQGEDKLKIATRFVLDFLGDDKKLLALGEEKVKQLIEARLNQTQARPIQGVELKTTTSPDGGVTAIVSSMIPVVAVEQKTV